MKRKLGLLVIVVLLLAGCSSYERAQVPPKVTIGGGNTVAVLFFDNFTSDYAISREVEQQLVEKLAEYYRVLDPIETEWAVVRLNLLRGESPSPDQVIRLGQMLGVDAVIFGEVSGYFAPITQTPPYRNEKTRVTQSGQLEYQWEMMQNTSVMVSFSGRVMETRSGNTIYRQRAEGEASRERKDVIDWLPEGKQPNKWFIPGPNNYDVPDTRKYALRQAINQFTTDLMPTYVWNKVDKVE